MTKLYNTTAEPLQTPAVQHFSTSLRDSLAAPAYPGRYITWTPVVCFPVSKQKAG